MTNLHNINLLRNIVIHKHPFFQGNKLYQYITNVMYCFMAADLETKNHY